ncbi:hypothetical protein EVAR_52910_1 [Eumeta japonica]|uniref:Uncharacterized protein n=1 Tax=Eumeta variegata TaxID=151549 RepID=A0A4C1Y7B4_EUMVA|nr:hypothetical protein EVAR_52910_1 [Eumeta japonica]
MAGTIRGAGKLESQIYCIKYTLFCFNVVLWKVWRISRIQLWASRLVRQLRQLFFIWRRELSANPNECSGREDLELSSGGLRSWCPPLSNY